jgi:hypothetical protein
MISGRSMTLIKLEWIKCMATIDYICKARAKIRFTWFGLSFMDEFHFIIDSKLLNSQCLVWIKKVLINIRTEETKIPFISHIMAHPSNK